MTEQSDGLVSEAPRDRFAAARTVADATLYEGYVLYPYRASSTKNQVRWQFGVLAPRAWAEADGSERWRLRTECIVDPGPAPDLGVRVRFLQQQRRTVEAAGPEGFAPVDSLVVDGVRWVPWDEAVERVVDVGPLAILPVDQGRCEVPFAFEAGTAVEELRDAQGSVVGRVVRRWDDGVGVIRVEAAWAAGYSPLAKLTVEVTNSSAWDGAGARRDQAMARSLLGVHTLLAVDDGTFVSLLDPPADAEDAARDCDNDGTYPVLVADPTGGGDVVLSSPITLYDHPIIAPESQGDLYDSTEIDEILALRVLTLTDEEKSEARATDPRAAAIVDRCDTMAPEAWEGLHGTMRTMGPDGPAVPVQDTAKPWWDPAVDAEVDPWSDAVRIGTTDVAKGTRVVLRPSHRADAQDLFLSGMAATVAGVFNDVDGTQQVAVTVDDDPATEALSWQGRYLFFFPDEIEVVS
ncbi:hypothetical protein [Iamia sp.]|uniref:hypothetical protein n=1 Tax=Iamia sp. TaxID=2722710 RepID=UPI002CEDA5D5|nr:hypothetical protein [Iamia sp.]HXH56623.1 hypothetical protein [Iamia sp.]